MKKSVKQHLAIALEGSGIAVIAAAISLEIYYGADWGFVMATSGAWAIATGSLIWAKLLRGGPDE